MRTIYKHYLEIMAKKSLMKMMKKWMPMCCLAVIIVFVIVAVVLFSKRYLEGLMPQTKEQPKIPDKLQELTSSLFPALKKDDKGHLLKIDDPKENKRDPKDNKHDPSKKDHLTGDDKSDPSRPVKGLKK